jgi:O-6-methylguanine DNA methyltransferase
MATDPSVPLRVLRLHLPRGASPVLRHAAGYVRAVLEGRIPGKIPPLDPAAFQQASAFRGAVWRTLGKIERGRTATYAQLARRAGHPRAARAAGSACGANPLPLFIPCHRVLAAGGRLGGFSAGLAWKRHLLAVERAQP